MNHERVRLHTLIARLPAQPRDVILDQVHLFAPYDVLAMRTLLETILDERRRDVDSFGTASIDMLFHLDNFYDPDHMPAAINRCVESLVTLY